MLHSAYKDETDFRTHFIRPLLTRLGYIGIAELHGAQEFGKDFVFAEITPFGYLKYHAAVVKHEATINQGAKVEAVLTQVEQAFNVRFRLPDAADEHGVSSVYVFNSGKITENARTLLRSSLSKKQYGENVHIFDSERLQQLDLTSSYREQQLYLPRLDGLEKHLLLNIGVWQNINSLLPKFGEVRGSFTNAIEGYLSAPFLSPGLDANEISLLLQESRIIDAINTRHMGVLGVPEDIKEQDIELLRSKIKSASSRALRIRKQLKQLTERYVPLSQLAVSTEATKVVSEESP